MQNKKSQIQIMETIAIMMIFFVLLILGFVFYVKIASYGQAGKISKAQELESIRVSQAISYFPELQCSSKNIVKENCFDKYKLDAFANIPQSDKDKVYYPFFYFSTIKVSEIYPGTGSWTLYNKTKNTTSYQTFVPILLLNAIERTYSFGIMTVQSYQG